MHHQSKSYGPPVLAFIGGAVVWALFGDKFKEKLNESKTWRDFKKEAKSEAVKVKDMTKDRYEEIVRKIVDAWNDETRQ